MSCWQRLRARIGREARAEGGAGGSHAPGGIDARGLAKRRVPGKSRWRELRSGQRGDIRAGIRSREGHCISRGCHARSSERRRLK
jgi:hypothetical protein